MKGGLKERNSRATHRRGGLDRHRYLGRNVASGLGPGSEESDRGRDAQAEGGEAVRGERGGARARAAASRSSWETQQLLVRRALIQSRQSAGAAPIRRPTRGGGEVGRSAGESMGGDGVRVCFWPASGVGVRNKPIDLPAGST